MSRPGTSGTFNSSQDFTARSRARKPPKLSIREIVEKDGGKRPTAKELIRGLEDNVRKVLEQKRHDYDQLKYQLKKQKTLLAQLETELEDLRKDGKALGLDEYPDEKERLKPVKEISTRPVFTKHTSLETLVQELKAKKSEIEVAELTGQTYEHMRKRLMEERVEEKKRNRDLKIQLRKEQMKNADRKRKEIAAAEAMGNAQAKLKRLRKRVREELEMWQREIREREEWQKQRNKFETFLKKQADKQKELEMEVQGDMGSEAESELRAKMLQPSNKHISRRVSMTLEAATAEEKRYEDAFRKIGLKLEDLNPQKVIEACIAQDEIRRELLRKRKAEEERVEDLKQQLATAQAELQQQEFDETRTTNRLLSKKEAELNRAEKRLEAERSEYQFMQATVQPVKIGLQQLAKKVLETNVELNDIAEIEWVTDQVQSKLSQLMEDTRQVGGDLGATGDSFGGGLGTDRTSKPAISLSSPSLLDPGLADLPSWMMSPYNIRIAPSRKEEDEETEERKGRRRQRRQDAEKDSLLGVVGLGGAAEQDDDDDSDVEVYGRLEIKAAAEAEVMRQTKQSNRRRARKNRK